MSKKTEILSLTSLRGIAAIFVLIHHFAALFYPAVVNGPTFQPHSSYDGVIYGSPLGIFVAGGYAVQLFFIISGFVLTIKFFQNKQGDVFGSIIKRYFRLMPIAALSVMVSFFLLSFGLLYHKHAADIADSTIVHSHISLTPNFVDALYQATIGIFVTQSNGVGSYNPVLWTIYYELIGSILVLGLVSVVMKSDNKKRWLLYVIAIISFLNTSFVGFIVGMLLADLYANHRNFYSKAAAMSSFYKVILLLFAFAIAAMPGNDSLYSSKYWSALVLYPKDLTLSQDVLQIISASILVFCVLSFGKLSKLLSTRVPVFLGRISFGFYALHFLFLYSVTSLLFIKLEPTWLSYNWSAIIAIITTAPVLILISYFVHIYVEKPSLSLANIVKKWAQK